jgi:hypothetical protein
MTFYVSYSPSAQDELAQIWLDASDKDAVTTASYQIDQSLRSQPLSVGEELGSYRRLQVAPLEVVFTVSPDDCLVQVWRVSYVP